MLRLLLGLPALAFGLVLGAGDGFLVAWDVRAGRAADVAARGAWLLPLYLPHLTATAALLAAVTAAHPRRRDRRAAAGAATAAVVAVLAAAGLLYEDPAGTAWRVLDPARSAGGPVGAGALDVGLVLAGGWLVARSGRGRTRAP